MSLSSDQVLGVLTALTGVSGNGGGGGGVQRGPPRMFQTAGYNNKHGYTDYQVLAQAKLMGAMMLDKMAEGSPNTAAAPPAQVSGGSSSQCVDLTDGNPLPPVSTSTSASVNSEQICRAICCMKQEITAMNQRLTESMNVSDTNMAKCCSLVKNLVSAQAEFSTDANFSEALQKIQTDSDAFICDIRKSVEARESAKLQSLNSPPLCDKSNSSSTEKSPAKRRKTTTKRAMPVDSSSESDSESEQK